MMRVGCVFGVLLAVLAWGCGEEGDGAGDGVRFENVRAEEVTGTRAVIRFSTSVPTTCEVRYGLEAEVLDGTATDPSMSPDEPYAILHEVPLEDLMPETTYHYRAEAETPGGERYESELYTLTTGEAGAVAMGANVARIDAGASVMSVSSNFGGAANSEAWGVERALDGEMSTEWSTNGDGDGAFVELALASETELVGWGFRSRAMADGSSIVTRVRLVVGEQVLGPFETPDPNQMYVFTFDAPVRAAVVRVEAVETTGGNTGAKEIQLYASP